MELMSASSNSSFPSSMRIVSQTPSVECAIEAATRYARPVHCNCARKGAYIEVETKMKSKVPSPTINAKPLLRALSADQRQRPPADIFKCKQIQNTTKMLLSQSSRPICRQCAKQLQNSQPVRHATLLKRPKRPYQFTQLITLSDGSTFTHRTSSPAPIYKSTKDTKNHAMWNPSSQKLLNVEEDEAGRLRRFRAKFGRGYDAETMSGEEEVSGKT